MERLSFELIEALSASPLFNVTALVPHTQYTSLFYHRVSSVLFAIGVVPRALIAARDADVVHIGDPVLSFIGWLIKKVLRKKVVVTVHGLDVTYSNSLYQMYLALFLKRFDRYLPISEHAKNLLTQRPVSGTVSVIRPGIRDRMYDLSKTRNDLTRIVSLPIDAKVLFTAGRLVKRKGHAWFIENVLPELPANTHYVIAGDGSERETIMRTTQRVNLKNRVHLLGRVSDADLKILYNTADAFIQPNIVVPGDAEGFGLVVREAASCGLPIIASRIEGLADAVSGGNNGVLVESENAEQWISAVSQQLATPQNKEAIRSYTISHSKWSDVVRDFYRAIL